MITKLNHVSIFVLNQESAYEFYVNKLGFRVHTDAQMGPGMRWLTVCPPEQPDLEISLMPVEEGMMFKGDAARQMKELIKAGTFGFGVFQTMATTGIRGGIRSGTSLPLSMPKAGTLNFESP